MKRVSLAVAVLFALVGFSAPCSAQQYWPNMRDFNIPSNEDVTEARVKAALQEGKYRAEIQNFRKIAVSKACKETQDLDAKIEKTIIGTIKDINSYVSNVKKCTKKVVDGKSYCQSGYALAPMYEDINNFSAAAEDLQKYLFVVQQCREVLKARYLHLDVAENCKNVLSNKTYGYSKIMEISFRHDDRANFFDAKKSLARHFKTIKTPIAVPQPR